jgi:hypothetical protein
MSLAPPRLPVLTVAPLVAVLGLSACAGVGERARDVAGHVDEAVRSVDMQTRQDVAAVGLAYKLVKPSGADLVIFGLAYLVYDPFAPNWEIQETRLSEDIFQMQFNMKRHSSGGEGEAMRVFRRRAAQLQRELGYDGYRILDYSEGIESATLAAYRVGEGRVQLTRRQDRQP